MCTLYLYIISFLKIILLLVVLHIFFRNITDFVYIKLKNNLECLICYDLSNDFIICKKCLKYICKDCYFKNNFKKCMFCRN